MEEGLQSSQLEEELFLVDSEEEKDEEEEEKEEDQSCMASLARSKLCDSLPDCPGGEDEADCQFGRCLAGESQLKIFQYSQLKIF